MQGPVPATPARGLFRGDGGRSPRPVPPAGHGPAARAEPGQGRKGECAASAAAAWRNGRKPRARRSANLARAPARREADGARRPRLRRRRRDPWSRRAARPQRNRVPARALRFQRHSTTFPKPPVLRNWCASPLRSAQPSRPGVAKGGAEGTAASKGAGGGVETGCRCGASAGDAGGCAPEPESPGPAAIHARASARPASSCSSDRDVEDASWP